MAKQVLRRDWHKKPRFCSRKSKMKWRRARGRHNKIRRNEKGYPKSPRVGFKTPRSERGLIAGKKAVMIFNLADIGKIKTGEIGIISSTVGKKSKIEIAKKAIESKIQFANLNAEKFLSEIKKVEPKKEATVEKPIENKEKTLGEQSSPARQKAGRSLSE